MMAITQSESCGHNTSDPHAPAEIQGGTKDLAAVQEESVNEVSLPVFRYLSLLTSYFISICTAI